MKQVKRKYKNKSMSNGAMPKFYTKDIEQKDIPYFESKGFEFIFEYICKNCKDETCNCTK